MLLLISIITSHSHLVYVFIQALHWKHRLRDLGLIMAHQKLECQLTRSCRAGNSKQKSSWRNAFQPSRKTSNGTFALKKGDLPSLDIPRLRHFWSRHDWQRFRLILSTTQFLCLAHCKHKNHAWMQVVKDTSDSTGQGVRESLVDIKIQVLKNLKPKWHSLFL